MSASNDPAKWPYVVAMTGASGAPYAVSLLRTLAAAGKTIHFTMSQSATIVLKQELNIDLSLEAPDLTKLGEGVKEHVIYHRVQNVGAAIASGSFPTAGMVVCPCSMSTLSSIAYGLTENLIARAADVHLKERRKLILVPRETPLSLVHLEAMTAVTRAGAIVLPAAPGWYHRPATTADLVDFVVARICDHLGVVHNLVRRWGGA